MKKFLSNLKHYFIPHSGNEHKPHFLRHESMFTVFLLLAVVEMAFLVQTLVVFPNTNLLGSVLPAVLTSQTNIDRALNGANPLIQNDLLDKAAQMKANDMAARGYFAHVSPDGKTPWYWLVEAGYKYRYAGENLAVNFFESSDVAEAWMNSPTHRANIIKKEYTEIGIGVASGVYEGRNTIFVAQFFGTPVSPVVVEAPKITENKILKVVTPVVAKIITKETSPVEVKPIAKSNTPTETKILGEETSTPIVASINTEKTSSFKLFIEKIITSPGEYSSYIYFGIALLVLLSLLLAIFIKTEIQHPAILARGVGMIAIILLLSYINIKALHIDTVVPSDSLESSVSNLIAE